LLPIYRTAEARGEIRGGRFVEPFGGEQFALIEAVEELRRLRRTKDADEWVTIAAADPANLVGSTDDTPRAPIPNRRLAFRNGTAVAAHTGTGVEWLADLTPQDRRHAAELLAPQHEGAAASRSARAWTRR
jgi:ATP-dependent Lhr-like helicase